MGIVARIVVYARADSVAQPAVAAAFARIAELEDVFSDYRPDSEVRRLQRSEAERPVVISRALLTVMLRADQLFVASGGAFDPTVGPLTTLWRRSHSDAQLPDAEEIEEARQRMGWTNIRIDSAHQTVTLGRSDLSLDFGGIAKGFAGDEALRVLRLHGIDRALIELGGDIVVGDAPYGEPGWRIDGASYGAVDELVLANKAVSTSGDSQQFVEINGVRYSHIVDPRRGLGLTHGLTVTVVADNGLTADGLSTTVGVLGACDGERLARTFPDAQVYCRAAGRHATSQHP